VGERAVLEEERLEEMGIAGFNETPGLQRRQIQRSRNIISVAPAACVRLFLASKIWRYDSVEENLATFVYSFQEKPFQKFAIIFLGHHSAKFHPQKKDCTFL
jgi:hypothetical protein